MSDSISRQDVLKLIENTPYDWSNITERTEMLRKIKALSSTDRLIKEAVSTLIHTKGDDAVSVAFRNAGRFVQNAIDGEPPEFEEIPSVDRPTGKWELIEDE